MDFMAINFLAKTHMIHNKKYIFVRTDNHIKPNNIFTYIRDKSKAIAVSIYMHIVET